MAHELTISANGRAEIAYVGETPWHGLGQKGIQPETVQEMVDQRERTEALAAHRQGRPVEA